MYTREVRRQNRLMPEPEVLELLKKSDYGVLALTGVDGMPYGVPLSYIFEDGCISFHSAREGYKVDSMKKNTNACFTVAGPAEAVYDGSFSTYYESAMVFGTVEEVTDSAERYRILYALAEKYLPGDIDKADAAIKRSDARTAVYTLRPLRITGKHKPHP